MKNWQIYPISDFPSYTQQWDELNRVLYQSHPMLDSRFVGALINHFADEQTFLAVYPPSEDQKGNLLLLRSKKSIVWDTFLPSQTQIAPLLCSYPQALNDLFKALPRLSISINLLCQDPLYTFSAQALKRVESFTHAKTINICLKSTFNDYWNLRSKNLRQNLKRYFNRLDKDKMVYRLNVISALDELLPALKRYGELETKSWKGENGTAISIDNEQGGFYKDILSAFARSKQAEIIELYFNDRLAASRITIMNDDMLIILKTTYDEELSSYAPGRLLLYLLIEREFSLKRVKHIEFYTNASSDQISWSSGQRDIVHLTTYRSNEIQRLAQYRRFLRERLQTIPA